MTCKAQPFSAYSHQITGPGVMIVSSSELRTDPQTKFDRGGPLPPLPVGPPQVQVRNPTCVHSSDTDAHESPLPESCKSRRPSLNPGVAHTYEKRSCRDVLSRQAARAAGSFRITPRAVPAMSGRG